MSYLTFSEQKALRWLKSQGFQNIRKQLKTPDFLADSEGFEVKRAVGNQVIFSHSQVQSLKPADRILIFTDSEESPVAETTWQKVQESGNVAGFKLYVYTPNSKLIRLDERAIQDLHLLQLAWKKRSLSEVVVELLKDHQLDKIRAIGIEVADEVKEETGKV